MAHDQMLRAAGDDLACISERAAQYKVCLHDRTCECVVNGAAGVQILLKRRAMDTLRNRIVERLCSELAFVPVDDRRPAKLGHADVGRQLASAKEIEPDVVLWDHLPPDLRYVVIEQEADVSQVDETLIPVLAASRFDGLFVQRHHRAQCQEAHSTSVTRLDGNDRSVNYLLAYNPARNN